jgi:hypothetical protein
MVALGNVCPQYWLCEEISTKNFSLHLDKIKVAFCVDKRGGGKGWMVFRLLDSRLLDVDSSYFKLTMNHNVETMMWKPTNVNLIT